MSLKRNAPIPARQRLGVLRGVTPLSAVQGAQPCPPEAARCVAAVRIAVTQRARNRVSCVEGHEFLFKARGVLSTIERAVSYAQGIES